MKIDSAVKYTSRLIDVWMPAKIKYADIPGVAIGIFYKGKLLYQKGFGFADIEHKKKMKPDSLFRVASMSKMFTSVAILQLQEQKRLRLDDKISSYLPWFKGKNNVGDLKNVTIRQVLSHMSGLFRDGEKPYWYSHSFPHNLEKTISNRSIIFRHSKTFKYSNHGYSVLGAVIKKVSGIPYNRYVKENIIDVLGLKSTYPDLKSKTKLSNLAKGYGRIIPGQNKREIFPNITTYAYSPATGFISDVSDLAIFLNSLVPYSKGHQILSENSKREMRKVYSKTKGYGDYGLGLHIKDISKKRKIIGHDGGFSGYLTYADVNPKDGLGVIVLSNSLSYGAAGMNEAIFETLYYFLDKPALKNPKVSPYSGIYRDRWSDSVVADEGNSLLLFYVATANPMKGKFILKPITKHKFRIEAENGLDALGEIAEFTSFKKGKATKLLWGPNPSFRYDK